MGKNLKISLVLVAVAVAVALVLANTGGDDSGPSVTRTDARLVRPDDQRLEKAPGSAVTFVEFLDFECEACGAAYPAVEQLRRTYAGRFNFVIRYMPLHNNSEGAAQAAEAAAAQGKFEQMYDQLFRTQAQWGEKNTSQREVFFGFARQLGLDMTKFQKVYEDPATLARIRQDKADGEALGVTGTPTFFLDGKILDVSSFGQLTDAVGTAVAAG